MSDKSFGVKKINLIGASGTPTIESPNNLNLNATTVAISTDVTIGGQVQSDLKINQLYSVGIGTTNPKAKLDVNGSLNVSGVSTISVNSSSDALRITQTGSGNALVVEDSTNPDSSPFIVNSSGRVGVGETNPKSSLHVSGTILSDALSVTVPFTPSSIFIDQALPSFSRIGVVGPNTSTLGQFVISQYSTDASSSNDVAFVIDSSGNAGIGSQTPTAKLDVNGSLNVSATLNVTGVSTFNNGINITEGDLKLESSTATLSGIITASPLTGIQTHFGLNAACNSDASSVMVVGLNTYAQGTISVFDRNGNDYDFIGIVTDTNTAFKVSELPADCVMSDDGTIFAFSSGNTTVGAGNTIIVWQRSGSTLSQLGTIEYDTLTGFDPTEVFSFGVEFGCSLDMSADGTKFVVGAERDQLSNVGVGTTISTGRVHVIDRIGSTFTGIATLSPDPLYEDSGTRFGFNAAMSDDGNTIVVSQPLLLNTIGAIYKFTRVGNTITQVGLTTTVGNVNGSRGLGLEISGDGTRIFVGCNDSLDATGALLVLDSDLNLLEEINLNHIPGAINTTREDRKRIQSSYDGKTFIIGSTWDGISEIYKYSDVLGRYILLGSISEIEIDHINGVAISQDGRRAFIGDGAITDGELLYYDITGTSNLICNSSIGIGTTNPQAKLDVNGSLNVSGVSTISVNSSSDALRITQTGTGNALVVEDSTNPDSSPFVIGNTGLVGLGTTNPTSRLHMVGVGSDGPTLQFENLSTSLASGDDLGTIDFISNDSSTNANGSRVRLLADVTDTTGNGRFAIQTKTSSSVSFATPLSVYKNTLSRSGSTSYTDAVNLEDYKLLINNFNNDSEMHEIYGYTSFSNDATSRHVLIDLTPYLNSGFGYSNFVTVEATGSWINSLGTVRHIVSRIYSASYYTNSSGVWSVQPTSLAADETDSADFPVATRIILGLYSDNTSTIPQLRLYGRNTTSGVTYYSFKLTTMYA